MNGVSGEEDAVVVGSNSSADALTDLVAVSLGINVQVQNSRGKGELTVYIVDQSI